MADFVVGLVVAAMLGAAIVNMMRSKRSNKSAPCGGNCSHCSGGCH